MVMSLELWRIFLRENEGSLEKLPFQIYCDMDGVLVDLPKGILDKADMPVNSQYRKAVIKIIGSNQVWQSFKKNPKYTEAVKFMFKTMDNDVDFWATLPKMEDADKLWEHLSQYNPHILSAPWDMDSEEGKRIWVYNNLIPQPNEVELTRDKFKFAITESPDGKKYKNVLIDDMPKYIGPWRDHGGHAIEHTSAESSIAQLEEYLSNPDQWELEDSENETPA